MATATIPLTLPTIPKACTLPTLLIQSMGAATVVTMRPTLPTIPRARTLPTLPIRAVMAMADATLWLAVMRITATEGTLTLRRRLTHLTTPTRLLLAIMTMVMTMTMRAPTRPAPLTLLPTLTRLRRTITATDSSSWQAGTEVHMATQGGKAAAGARWEELKAGENRGVVETNQS
eukprot:TRINITY_DN1336_c0_g2_i1.p3 TRINITY_DN1336_c0_g2~~TRINITY_DN1336_c0_g2_i1.p3  ORF type:complete len:175 (+),score=36.91 TRINITY_DN1336_c0_g2_i1:1647-2171(+)